MLVLTPAVLVQRSLGAPGFGYYRALTELVAGRLSVTHSVAAAPLVEMGQKGLTKARTLEQYAAERGILEVALDPEAAPPSPE